jgi:RND family efflux transporter MFP subunit
MKSNIIIQKCIVRSRSLFRQAVKPLFFGPSGLLRREGLGWGLIAALIMGSCSRNHPVDMAQDKPETKAQYETVQIEKNSISSIVKIPGILKPFEKVDIYPKMNGFVKEMYVDRGSIVHKGQVLMTLEAPEIVQQVQAAQEKWLQAQENINASRDRYVRLKAASKIPGSISDLDLTNAQAKYQADSALVQSELANLNAVKALQEYLTVKAPFDGIITERNVHPGALTGPSFKMDNKPLLILEDNTKLRLETFIPEAYSGSVDMSDRQVSFSTLSLPGQVFTAPISRSSHSLYDEYRSEAIEADVTNQQGIFKPGMYVEAVLKIKSPVSSMLVPSSCIVTTMEGKYVVALDNGKTKYINIKEGISTNGKTEIFGDIKGDEILLKKPSGEIKEGILIH